MSPDVAAHIDVTDPPMRGGNQKTGPCEGTARGNPMELEAGATIPVTFVETVDHPGTFVISFDPDGDDFDGDGDGQFDYPMFPNTEGSGNGNDDLVLGVFEETGTQHTFRVTLPDISCDNCTLQVIQVMTEPGRVPTEMNPYSHLYFRCLDVVLTGGSEPGSGGSAGAAQGGSGGDTDEVPAGGSSGAGEDVEEPSGGSGGTPQSQGGFGGEAEPLGGSGGDDSLDPGPGDPPAPPMNPPPGGGGDTSEPSAPPATTNPPAPAPGNPNPTGNPAPAPDPMAGPTPMTSGSSSGFVSDDMETENGGGCSIPRHGSVPSRGAGFGSSWVLGVLLLIPLLRRKLNG